MKSNHHSLNTFDDDEPGSNDQPVMVSLPEEIIKRLQRIEAALELLIQQKAVKEWYTTDEVAAILGKAPFTVREWCRLGRVNADKRGGGRGKAKEWIIAHEELTRIHNLGLLPVPGYQHFR